MFFTAKIIKNKNTQYQNCRSFTTAISSTKAQCLESMQHDTLAIRRNHKDHNVNIASTYSKIVIQPCGMEKILFTSFRTRLYTCAKTLPPAYRGQHNHADAGYPFAINPHFKQLYVRHINVSPCPRICPTH